MTAKTKTYDSTTVSIDLQELKVPVERMAIDLDRSINWVVRKLLREHPSLVHVKKDKGVVK